MKNIYTTIFVLLSVTYSYAQDAASTSAKPSGGALLWSFENILLVIGLAVVVWVVYALIRLNFEMLSLHKAEIMKEMGMEKEEILHEIKGPTWRKVYDWMWNLVPVAEESNIDLGHDYDGIRELDNKLPPWWLILFYGSIIFAFAYMYKYHRSGSEWSSENEYYASVELAEKKVKENLARQANAVDESNVVATYDENTMLVGESIFMEKCAVCHGFKGEGLVGPNFTDKYWVHGGSIKKIFSVIKYGVPEKGMISWQSQLRPAEMQSVSSYILSMQGTDPPNQKDPEGEIWVPEPEEETVNSDL